VYLTTNDRPSTSADVSGDVSRRSLYTRKKPVPLRLSSARQMFDDTVED
jgi:hypothetical protein